MTLVRARILALLIAPSLLFACGSETPQPRAPVSSIGSTPPARPYPTTPPASGAGGSGGSAPAPATGGTGGTPATRPPDAGRTPDTASIPDPPPAAPACSSTVLAMGNDGLIDDFNDNNTAIRLADGRMGAWETAKSETSVITNQMMPGIPELPTVGGGAMNRGLRFRGNEPLATSQWAGEVTATFATDCYDASAYRGLQLAIRGLPGTQVQVFALTGKVRAQNTPLQVGGHYNVIVTINSATAFQTEMMLWDRFQPGWGATSALGAKVEPKEIYGITIMPLDRPAVGDAGVSAGIGTFDFTIDNVQLIPPAAAP